MKTRVAILVLGLLAAFGIGGYVSASDEGEHPRHIVYPKYPEAPRQQSREEADAKTAGCLSCHTTTDMPSMHANPGIILGCTDCHGGDAKAMLPAGTDKTAQAY